ncbi:MAG TPA: IclR family transcriptional regulator [Bauldia sp.]|nr:IclR family transcriptional regulator [Bauldia sp.]
MTTATNVKRARKSVAPPRARKAKPNQEQDPSNSLVRLLGLLDLFTPAAPAWPIDALIKSRGMSRSTGYRYVKALSDAGLLAAVSDGYYILGPRIIDLDRQIRQCDPLYIAGGPIMKQLVADTGHSALLCALFSGSVLCVREELTPDSPPNLFTRGQHRPLFQGAASKIILPYLRPHQLRSIYARHAPTIAVSGLGSDWDSFLRALAKIRSDGYVMTLGEFNSGVVGISAPIFNSSKRILGSVGIAGDQEMFTKAALPRLFEIVVAAGQQVTDRISAMTIGMDRPPRGVG